MPRLIRRMSCRYLVLVAILSVFTLSIQLLFQDPCSETERKVYELQRDLPSSGDVPTANNSALRGDTSNGIKDDVLFPVRIDWHDYKQIWYERYNRSGPGEQGTGAVINGNTSRQSAGIEGPCKDRYGYQHCVSQSISVNRSLTDTRSAECGKRRYMRDLPRVSLVLTCSREDISVILRAIYSIKLRTPKSLVAEVILVQIPPIKDVDGIADVNDDQRRLEATLRHHHPDLVLLQNLPDAGIAGARMTSARRASGDILVFIQLPVEVNVNWLPPLIEPIVVDERVVTSPQVDTIDPDTFEYKAGIPKHGSRTGFDWNFTFQEFAKLPGDNKTGAKPYRTPIMENRAFAIHKSRFLELEGYDPGLNPLGAGEQYDLSFKVWLCGGEILYIPCSKVGLVNKRSQNIPDKLAVNDIMNYKRIARIWLSDYSDFVLVEEGNVAIGDVSAQLELQERLACKPFRWYLEKVALDLVQKYKPLKPSTVLGVIQNLHIKMCAAVMTVNKRSALLAPCQLPNNNQQTESLYLTSDGRLRIPGNTPMCVALNGRNLLKFEPCSSLVSDQVWTYNTMTKTLMHKNTDRCLTASSTGSMAYFPKCPKPAHLRDYSKWNIAKDLSQLDKYIPLKTAFPPGHVGYMPGNDWLETKQLKSIRGVRQNSNNPRRRPRMHRGNDGNHSAILNPGLKMLQEGKVKSLKQSNGGRAKIIVMK